MWIKQIRKSNTPKGKTFYQYQFTRTMRIDGKVKHKSILYLGYHSLPDDKNNRRMVAKLLEYKIRGLSDLPEHIAGINIELKQLADKYYDKYLVKHQQGQTGPQPKPQAGHTNYYLVDISSTQVFNTREIGAEWLCYKVAEHLDIRGFLKRQGWKDKWIEYKIV